MGTVKIELDLPNFEKEIELKVIINKDGVQSSTPLIDRRLEPINCQIPSDASGQAWKESVSTSIATPPYDPNNTCYIKGSTGMANGVGTLSTGGPTTVTTAKPESVRVSSKPIPSSMMGTF